MVESENTMIIRTLYPNYSLLPKLRVINSKKEPGEKAGWKILSQIIVYDCKEGDEFHVMIEFLAKNESLRERKPKGLSVRVTSKVLANETEIIPAGGYNITPEGHYGLFSRQGIYKATQTADLTIDLYVKAACTQAKESDYIEFGDITSIQAIRVN